MVKTIVLLAAVVTMIVAGAAVYFLFIAAPQSNAPSNGSSNQTAQTDPQTRQVRVKLTEMDDKTETWIPSTIYMKKGQTYELTIINGDGEDTHKFIVPDLNVESKDIAAANGQEKIQITPTKEGTFNFTDPTVPDWSSAECSAKSGSAEQTCVKPGQIIVEP